MANTLVPQIWTPGSDYTLGVSDSQIVYTRDGNDSIITYNPGVNNDGQQKLDIWISDQEVPLLEQQQPRPGRDWQNRFIVGDWQQPYYVNSQASNLGLNEFVTIIDLDPNRDIIQLHGSPENYLIEEAIIGDNEQGTAIFWQEGTRLDLVAFLPRVSGIDLEDDLFQFEGNTPPPVSFSGEARQLGTTGIDLSTSSATDVEGNIYVAGATSGSLQGNNAGVYDPIVTKYDSDGNQIWNIQFGSANFDWITDIVTDNQGNFYVAGYTEGNLGATKNAEVADVWVAKYNSDGNQIWIQQFGTEVINRTFGIDVDDDGNVYLSGYTIEETRTSQTDDSWVTKYDSNGNRQWFTEFGTRQYDEAYDIAVDNEGNVYSTGWTLGDLGGDNSGIYDIWVAKHDNDGELQFIQQFGSEDYEFPWGIDTDSEGNVYITGWTLGDLAGDNAGSYDTWVAKYNSNGDRQWIRQFGTQGDDSLLYGDIEIDSNDNIFLTGYTDGDLGGDNAGSYDTWVAKYNSNGDRQWIQQFGTPDFDYAHDISSDDAGHLYVTGITEGSLGGTNAGAADSWVARLDADSGSLQDFSGNSDSATISSESNRAWDFSTRILEKDSLVNYPKLEDRISQDFNLLSPLGNGLTNVGEFNTNLIDDLDIIGLEEIVDSTIQASTVGTPGSDIFPFLSAEPSEYIWGRNGNDVLIGFDPGAAPSDQFSVDEMAGDQQEGFSRTEGSDIFILGDWRKPYYDDVSTEDFGLSQYAIINDFQPELDTIKLHGTQEDYFLDESEDTTLLFLEQPGTNPDLIAILSDVSGLTLSDEYFQFEGNTPPPIAIDGIGQLGTPGVDEITSVAIAPNGSTYLAGYSSGSLGGTNQGSNDAWFGKYDSDGNQLWSRQIGTEDWDGVWDIDTDNEGNLYLVGTTRGDLVASNPGIRFDVWVSKYDSDGNQLWIQQFEETEASLRIDVAPDGDTFSLSGVNLGQPSGWSAFVGKYDSSDGTEVWFNEFGTGRNPDESYAVAIDDQDNVFASGWTSGDLGGENAGQYDVWITKFDSSGNQQWIRQLGSDSFEFSWGIDTDSEGNVYVGGWTSGNLAAELKGSYDGFLAKYDSEGNQVWTEQFGSSGDDEVTNIFVSEDDYIYVTGFTNGNLGGESDGSYDAFAAKYDSDGNQIWIEQFGSSGTEQAKSIAVDPLLDNVYVTGVTDSSLGAFNQGAFDGWVAILNSDSGI
ncbi:MAG: SBBP repeat-containing protein [Xenococcaceae cyanobacterium MO_167.B27]|nr:SBBP repeat-containing protein [Xenococcaceae cyanobacterium MO_167.B27]